MRRLSAIATLLLACSISLLPSCVSQEFTPHVEPVNVFQSADECANCHPNHADEWRGSVMHYAAVSPVFNAFELTIEKLSQGAVSPNGANPSFCAECHAPLGRHRGEQPDFVSVDQLRPLVDSLSESTEEGITCDFCHRVTGPDLEKSLTKDGIGNFSLFFSPSEEKLGPIGDPVASPFHRSTNSDYLQSSDFCGSCHDVRIPAPDVVTGEPFQRLENLFTEWQNSPYNSTANKFGKVIRCQDCHMSMYPLSDPGVFPQAPAAVVDNIAFPDRQHALHAFTAVSVPFVDDPRFPNITSAASDSFGFPIGQQQRREMLLRAAVTMSLDETPGVVNGAGGILPIRVTVENTGAGHNVPSGFSQEREVWIHLEVRDQTGIIYESGYLRDSAHPATGELTPDGRLDDEDLDHRHFELDLETFETKFEAGPDADLRPQGINLGIVSFQNNFLRQLPDGSFEPTLNPTLTNHMDNSRSLPPLQPRTFAYDVPIPQGGVVGQVTVTARLNYRAFPPEFLRFLAEREHLFGEELVDRNTIVEMAAGQKTITVQ